MNTNRILRKFKAFNSVVRTDRQRIKELKTIVLRQIKEDKNKKSKAALKRIENNKEWLFVYECLLALI